MNFELFYLSVFEPLKKKPHFLYFISGLKNENINRRKSTRSRNKLQ